jgi:hypothetical protein
LEDAMNLWEVIMTTRFNEWLAIKHAQQQGG